MPLTVLRFAARNTQTRALLPFLCSMDKLTCVFLPAGLRDVALTPWGINGLSDHAVKQLSAYFISSESNMPKCISPKLEERTNTSSVYIKITDKNIWHRLPEKTYIQKRTADLSRTWDWRGSMAEEIRSEEGLRPKATTQVYESLSSALDWILITLWPKMLEWPQKKKKKGRTILCLSFNSTDGRCETQHQGNHRWFSTGGRKHQDFSDLQLQVDFGCCNLAFLYRLLFFRLRTAL